MKKCGHVLAVLIILSVGSPLMPAFSQGHFFLVESVSFRSSVGGDVYPGSTAARLVVGVRYQGAELAKSIYGCLEAPPGFSTQYRCVGARDVNGSYVSTAEFGEVVYFTFALSVERAVNPGLHVLRLNTSAKVGNSLESEILEFEVYVSPYPELEVELLDAYWSPSAYPGTTDTTLFLAFRLGSVRIDSASVTVELPEGFYPQVVKRTLGNVRSYSTFTVVVSGVSVGKSVVPGTYGALVSIDATAITDDGVYYSAAVSTLAAVAVDSPPQLSLKIVTSGWADTRVPSGSKGSSYRVIMRLEDAATIDSIVATMKLPDCAKSANGSSSIVTYINRPVEYGDVFELIFGDISLMCTSTAAAELVLDILATKGGSELWVTQAYKVPIAVQNPAIDIRVATNYWSPGPAYPGSKDLSLVLVVENYDYVSLYGGVAKLNSDIVDPGESIVSNIVISPLDRITIVFRGLSIPRSVAPGTYELRALLDTLVRAGGAVFAVTVEFRVVARVSEPPSPRLEVLSFGWLDSKAFSNSTGNTLRIIIRNSDPSVTIRSMIAYLDPPKCFSTDSLRRSFVTSTPVAYGYTVTLEFGGMDIFCARGTHRANLTVEVLGEIAGSSFWQNIQYSLALEVDEPALNIEVADIGWVSGIAYRNSSRLAPYITLVSYTKDSLMNTVLYVRPANARLSDGGNEAAIAMRDPVPYGSSITVRLPTLELEGIEGPVEIDIRIVAQVRRGQAVYNASRRLEARVPLVSERNLALTWSHIEFGGSPSPLLPTARGVAVHTLITNLRTEPVAVSKIGVSVPRGFKVLGVEGDCHRATLAGGGTCGLSISLHVGEEVKPLVYTLLVEVEYVKLVSGASLYNKETLVVPVAVEPVNDYIPDVRLLEVFWGIQQPVPVFPNSRYVPLTLVLSNLGRYEASGAVVKAASSRLVPVAVSAVCAARLPPGGTCSAVLYFDVPPSTRGFIELNVSIEYYMTSFGAYFRVARTLMAWLYVEPVEVYGGVLRPVSWGWLNNYNVFPRTENATFVVTVVNRLPHSVAGVVAELYLPPGFRGNRGNLSVAYVDGPIRSYSSASIGFRVSVGGVSPGPYSALLRLDYVALSGGPGVRVVEEHVVELTVVDDSEAVEVVSSSWLEGSVEPGTYGVLLHLVVRNDLVDGMSGVFLQLDLPSGILSSIDNSSTIKIPPISQQVIQSLFGAGRLQPAVLSQLLQQAATATATHSRGDLIDFIVPLNLLVSTTGRYAANATLHYIDSWGTPRHCRFTIPITVLGSIRFIEAYIDGGTLRISSRFTSATLKVRNIGSSPAYNVYITVIPYSQLPVVIASPAVYYVDRLEAGREAEVVLTLAYNPMGIYAAGAQTVVSYGTVPLIVGVIYRDVGGRLRTFNTSIVVVVEPFVDLILRDSKASLAAGTLRVSGVLVNYGSATAYRAGARVCVGKKDCAESFIGDIEPGTQRAFSISVASQESAKVAELTIFYYNAYNEIQYLEYSIPVVIAAPATPTTPPGEQLLATERWVAIAAVTGFLTIVAYLIYRVAASYYRKLKAAAEVPPP